MHPDSGMSLYKCELSRDEILLLDGRCSATVQVMVDRVKRAVALVDSHGCTEEIAVFVADLEHEAKAAGKLDFSYKSLRYCGLCRGMGGYAKHKRAGRGYKAGDANMDKPLMLDGVEFRRQFVNMIGHANLGCCSACWATAKPIAQVVLADVRAAVPQPVFGVPPRFECFDNRTCTACKWEGHEGQMGRIPAIMSGFYRGECPACHAKNMPLGKEVVVRRDGFTVVLVEPKPEPAKPPNYPHLFRA